MERFMASVLRLKSFVKILSVISFSSCSSWRCDSMFPVFVSRSEIERKRNGILGITIGWNSGNNIEAREAKKTCASASRSCGRTFQFRRGGTRSKGITLLLLTLLGKVLGLGGNPVARRYISDHPDNRFAEGKLRRIFVSCFRRCGWKI